MNWSGSEIEMLSPVLEKVWEEAELLGDENLLVLCSATGEMAFWLAEKMKAGHIVGAEVDPRLVEASRLAAETRGLGGRVEFCPTEKTWLPFQDDTFDALISEFVVFSSPTPTEVGQPEMAQVLKPGGRMVITDVIAPQPVPPEIREELHKIGLEYLCEATKEDFHSWMEEAGLCEVEVMDITSIVRLIWEKRAREDLAADHRKGYALLLGESPVALGKGLFYIYARATKPDT